MTAAQLTECPVCDGAGERTRCRPCEAGYACSHEAAVSYRCDTCRGAGEVLATSVDRNGELITFDGCECDMDEPCSDVTCQMQRDLEQRRMFALYQRGALTPPRDVQRQMYADAMVDAGREHLAPRRRADAVLMTANLAGLLPHALVLIDTPPEPKRGVVVRKVHAPIGDGLTVEVCVGPCPRQQHSTDCKTVGFSPDDLLLVPTADTYGVGVAGAT